MSHLNRWLCLPQFRCSLRQSQPRHPWSVLFSSGTDITVPRTKFIIIMDDTTRTTRITTITGIVIGTAAGGVTIDAQLRAVSCRISLQNLEGLTKLPRFLSIVGAYPGRGIA